MFEIKFVQIIFHDIFILYCNDWYALFEAALNAELDDRRGYDRHEKSGGYNHRNGFPSKTVQTDVGQFELENATRSKRRV